MRAKRPVRLHGSQSVRGRGRDRRALVAYVTRDAQTRLGSNTGQLKDATRLVWHTADAAGSESRVRGR